MGQTALRIIRFALPIITIALTGCLGGEIEANKQQLAQQQVQLDQLKQEIQALQTQQASYTTAGMAVAGSCDDALMHEATRKGGQRFATGESECQLPSLKRQHPSFYYYTACGIV